MKSIKLNYFNKVLILLFYTTLLTVLIQPWLKMSLGKDSTVFQYLWIYFYFICLIILFNYFIKFKNNLTRFLLIASYFLINVLLINYIDWPVDVFYPLVFCLFLVAFHYWSYLKEEKLFFDIGAGLIILIINLAVQNSFANNIGIATVVFYLIINILLIMFYNIQVRNNLNSNLPYRILITIALVLVITAVIISFLFSFGFIDGLMSYILKLIGMVYNTITTIFLYLIYPLIWLLAKLFAFIKISLTDTLPEDQPQQRGLPMENQEPLGSIVIPDYISKIIGFLILAFIIYYIIKRINDKPSESDNDYTEERESIFTKTDLKNDLHRLWLSLVNTFTRKRKKNIYNQEDPILIIREAYYKFLILYSHKLKYYNYLTPINYQEKIKRYGKQIGSLSEYDNIKQLTSLYNQARYGLKGQSKEAEAATRLWHQIKDNNKKNN